MAENPSRSVDEIIRRMVEGRTRKAVKDTKQDACIEGGEEPKRVKGIEYSE